MSQKLDGQQPTGQAGKVRTATGFRRSTSVVSSHRLPTRVRGWIRAKVAGPIPRTSSNSSTRRNPPLPCRSSMIRRARVGPTPGSPARSTALARFRSRRAGAAEAVERGPGDPIEPARRTMPGLFRSSNGRIRSSVAGPIPGTSRRSSGVPKPPLSSRAATMARAVAGPRPGSRSSSTSEALLGSIFSPTPRRRCRASNSSFRRRLSARSSGPSSTAAERRVGLRWASQP